MNEINQFKVYRGDAKIVRAEAELKNEHMVVRIYYPRNPEPIEKRLEERLNFGAEVFQNLNEQGYSKIADEQHPIKPASAGSLYVLSDGKIICHRRDKFAPSHKLYHSAYAGFPNSKDFVYTAEGLKGIALRESAEECLLVTREDSGKKPRLVVPNDSKQYTLESAIRLGLNLEPLYVDVDVPTPTDVLEVYYEDGESIFKINTYLEFIYESQTSLNALFIRHFPLSSEEVIPVDAEGMTDREGKFKHFNRESYVIDPEKIKGKPFGSILENPEVYQTKIENGIPNVYIPTYTEPYLGPDKAEVISPHVWAPEDLMVRTLDALGVEGYKWREIESWKELSKLNGKSLLPDSVLKK